MKAKILFFDSNPIGRIVTRFSKDIMYLDTNLPSWTLMLLQGGLRFISVAITVAVMIPWLLIAIFVSCILLYLIMRIGSSSMSESQRVDSISRTPINSTLAMVMNGLVSLRAYKKLDFFYIGFDEANRKCANATFCYSIANRWLGLRLDAACLVFTSTVIILCLVEKGKMSVQLLSVML